MDYDWSGEVVLGIKQSSLGTRRCMINPYDPPDTEIDSTMEIDLDRDLIFSDRSDKQFVVQLSIGLAGTLFLTFLAIVGFSRGTYLFATLAGICVAFAIFAGFKSVFDFARPFEHYVAFDQQGMRIWNTKRPERSVRIERSELHRILIEQPNGLSYGTNRSYIERRIPGIHWTPQRLLAVEQFIDANWPEVRLDQL